jgi:two-component system sensor histidine kinase LytS
MYSFDLPPYLLHSLDNTPQLLQRICVLIVAALISIRFKWLRQVLLGAEKSIMLRLAAIAVFGLLAIIGTHGGMVIDLEHGSKVLGWSPGLFIKLEPFQAIVGFRDTITLMAGMIGGSWVGFGVGLVAGLERYSLGGFAALASGVATLILGIFTGLVKHYRPHWVDNIRGVFLVALVGTLMQRLILLGFVRPTPVTISLSWEVVIPVLAVNTLGCVLFFLVMRYLDHDRLAMEASEAKLLVSMTELSVLRAQIEPHFLNNCLNNIKWLIRKEPDRARDYVDELARFFNAARKLSGFHLIDIKQEVEQLEHYLSLQSLAMGRESSLRLRYHIEIPEILYLYQLIPFTLITLAENVFKHGLDASKDFFELNIKAEEVEDSLVFTVIDNGPGIARTRLEILGKSPVSSKNNGGGVALYQLAQSLQLMFADEASLLICSEIGIGTTIRLKQPKR